jgi:methylmalonyl-CoA/ethylmalonyl-CoA epimerase
MTEWDIPKPYDGTVPTDPPTEPLFLAVDHVGIAVPDLDAAIAWYRETFGLEVVHEEVNEEQGVREAMLAVGPHGARLQLLAPLDTHSAIARFLDRSGPGLQQLAYRVADVEAATRVLRGRGVRVLYDESRRGTAGSRINFLHPQDCGGVLVELVEPAAAVLGGA